ncbi:Calpain-5 [Lachnellula cervina]|uniref:Calpain-5 n=1 Tax=Lachnellula cervina TaxID=1316786 RepID=A0A7D8Z0F7_9HELO|nr:Calpain-5 [Lachnellula cervina]
MAAGSIASSGSLSSSRANNRAQEATPFMLVAAPLPHKKTKQSPQSSIDEFWSKFNSKTPGRATTILPKDRYAKQAEENALKGTIDGANPVSSYEEAARLCRDKVDKIVKECRRVNQKYTDKHFDLEFDLKGWNGKKDCLRTLTATSEDDPYVGFSPGSVKRVTDIFDNPQFFVEGATANDIRQGRDGDCWLLAALCTLGNKQGLIEKVCVARNEQVGVYGFVFHRGSLYPAALLSGAKIGSLAPERHFLTVPLLIYL